MSYTYITKYDSPNFGYPTGSRRGNNPKYIVIHHWGGDGQSFNGVVNWLCNPNAQASAHYVVEDRKVACIVNCADAAWHAGDKWYNTHSIGIECRPEMSNDDLETVIDLVADLYKTYGVLPIIGHKDIVPTACPGRYYKKLDYIKREASKRLEPKPQPKPPVAQLYRVRRSWKDAKSQLGAFKSLSNAIGVAKDNDGFEVYDEAGNVVWRKVENQLYRVRKSWDEPKSQIGAFKELDNALRLAKEKHYNVYDITGSCVYKG